MNTNTIGAAVIGIIIGAMGYAAVMPQSNMASMSMDDHGMAGHQMDHKSLQVDAEKPLPSVTIMAHKDTMSGFNIHVKTENYTVTPDKAGAEPVQGEGHMHVFVNGVKAMRLYGEWAHLPKELFKSGENTISVTLNANDHSDWAIGDKHIEASTVVTQ
jgi:hypothetical protein